MTERALRSVRSQTVLALDISPTPSPQQDRPNLVDVLPQLATPSAPHVVLHPTLLPTALVFPTPSPTLSPTASMQITPTDDSTAEPTSIPIVKPMPPLSRFATSEPISKTYLPTPSHPITQDMALLTQPTPVRIKSGHGYSPDTVYHPTYYNGLLPSFGGWKEKQDIPKFMTLPFSADPKMMLLQGWFYDSGGLQSGIDYFRLDQGQFTSFPIVAAADGYACGEWDPTMSFTHTGGGCVAGYGHRVLIRHEIDGKTYYTYYGHLETIANDIPLGDRHHTTFIERGHFLGYAGNTGTSGSAIHLHFGLFREDLGWLDPYDIRATHEVYPDPLQTNGRYSGFNDFWMTNPPTFADGSSLSAHSYLRPGLEQMWRPDFPSYAAPEEGNWRPEGVVLTPAHNAIVNGTVHIRGWARDAKTSISNIEIWLDGTLYHTATYGVSSPESGDLSGYNWDWDTTQQTNGVHTIEVRAVAKDNRSGLLPTNDETHRTKIVVNVQNLHGVIDHPRQHAVLGGKTLINGWAQAQGSDISTVEIWIDEDLRGVAEYGQFRADMNGPYGFRWLWDTTNERNGLHMIEVRVIAANGNRTVLHARDTISTTTLSVQVQNRWSFPLGKWSAR